MNKNLMNVRFHVLITVVTFTEKCVFIPGGVLGGVRCCEGQ